MELANILNTIISVLLPVIVLYKDWKYTDKKENFFEKITVILIIIWIFSALITAYLKYSDSKQISLLSDKSNELLIQNKQLQERIDILKKDNEDKAKFHDYKIDELAQKVVNMVNEGCLKDIDSMTTLLIEKHKEIFKSTEDESSKWATTFLAKIEKYNKTRIENIDTLTLQSNKSMPYFLALLEYVVNLFDNNVKDLSKSDIATMENKYLNIKLTDLDLNKNESHLIRKTYLQNGDSISMIVRGRMVTNNKNPIDHNSINIRHPRIDFILNQDENNINSITRDKILLRIESREIGWNQCWGFSDKCANGYIPNLGYIIDKDPLSLDDLTINIKRDVKNIFEIVYLNSIK